MGKYFSRLACFSLLCVIIAIFDNSQQSPIIAQNIERSKASDVDILQKQGEELQKKGELKSALDVFQKMLEITSNRQDFIGQANALNYLGGVYNDLGQYAKALKVYNRALEIVQSGKPQSGEAAILNNIGEVYRNLVQFDKALAVYQKALDIQRNSKDRTAISLTLNNIGIIYRNKKEYTDSLRYYQESLKLSEELNDTLGQAILWNNIGFVYNQLGLSAKAFDSYKKALILYQSVNDPRNESVVLGNIGLVYYNLGESESALGYYQQALLISRKTGDRAGEAKISQYIGAALNERKQYALAIAFSKQSVNIYEEIRKDLNSLSRQEQKGYANSVAPTYRRLADLLLKQERIIEALQVVDLLKVQELEDYLKNIKGNERSYQGVRLLEPEKAMINKALSSQIDQFPDLNQQLANQIQQLPKSEIDKAPEYLQKIPQGTALLYPLILDDRLEVVLFASNTPAIHRTVPVTKVELARLVNDFKKELQIPKSSVYKKSSQKLYDFLIKPIEDDLRNNKTQTILYAPDDFLRYIPISTLYDGKKFLIESYTINNLITYILSDFTPKPKIKNSVLSGAFGGKDGQKLFGQDALPATLTEVSAIAKLIQNSQSLTESGFTRQAIESQLPNYNILHLATHAEFNSGVPDSSFIIFGNGDTIRLGEIPDLKMTNVDLIVLSACQTAVVGKLGTGVEILGFGYQVQKAGAKSAIASLWKVDDTGTQSLMQTFYGYLKQSDRTKANALRQAQIDLIGNKNFSHPYYWSPFILIGNGL